MFIEDGYCVYRMINPLDLSVMYVGQGMYGRMNYHLTNLRANRHTNKELQAAFNELKILGKEPLIDVYAKHLIKSTAESVEQELIQKFGRRDLNLGTLFNKTDGGPGPSNPKLTEKQIETRKTTWKGKHHTDEAKAKISIFHKGKIVSTDTKLKQSLAALKRGPKSPETLEKLRQAGLKRKQSDETKQKCREAALKRWANRDNSPS